MSDLKNRYRGTKIWNRIAYFTMLNALFLISLCSGQAFAGCLTTSITATTPTADFVVNGNGTVTHTKTGLMWKVCSEGQTWVAGSPASCTGSATTTFTWQGALQQAQTVNTTGFAGFNDWRVPNKKELDSIVEEQCFNPSINTTIFPATAIAEFWTASPYGDTNLPGRVWRINFYYGRSYYATSSSTSPVRLVRGGY